MKKKSSKKKGLQPAGVYQPNRYTAPAKIGKHETQHSLEQTPTNKVKEIQHPNVERVWTL